MKEIQVSGKLSEESVKTFGLTFGLSVNLSRPPRASIIRNLRETHQSIFFQLLGKYIYCENAGKERYYPEA
jgi:hypothetical protein